MEYEKVFLTLLKFVYILEVCMRSKALDKNENVSVNNSAPLPNIVVFVCDSMDGRLISGGRYDGVVDMPNIKKLSQRGTTFLNAYTNNPICVPSRSAIWSGMHSHITESWNNYKGLPDSFNVTWADLLQRNAGYNMKTFGKVDYQSGHHSLSNRVEAWTRNVNFTLRQEARPDVKLTGTMETKRVNEEDWKVVDDAVKAIQTKSLEKVGNPLLLYVGTNLPHPYSTPSAGQKCGDSTFKTSPYWLNKVSVEKIHIPDWLSWNEMHPVDKYSTIVKNCSSEFTREELINIKSYFYAMCAETDAMLGEVMYALDRYGLSGTTYVFFTSDHGELAMEHQQFYKMSMYEGSAHVPMIIGYPTKYKDNHHQEEYVNNPVSLVDIYPTLMDLAGIQKPNNLNGSSLVKGRLGSHPGWILSQYHGCNVNASVYMLRVGSLKYIAFGSGPKYVRPLLFNLSSDPDELYDLAPTDMELVNKMDKFLLKQINYPLVTSKVMAYNKNSFIAWRNSEGKSYDESISNLRWWMDWEESPQKNFQAINSWLSSK